MASLASIAPYDAPGLDYFTGMGELNVDDIKLSLDDRDAARAKLAIDRDEFLQVAPEQVRDAWASLLSPADIAALSNELTTFLVTSMRDGLAPGDQGWWDDSCAHLEPWGFNFDDITVPVQLWHGAQDRFVPFQHGQWLAGQIPGVEAHLTEADGHLTLIGRVPEVHEWLMQHE